MNIKAILAVAVLAIASSLCRAQKITISALESGKLRVEVTGNKANGLKTLVENELASYNTANASNFSASDIEELKVGGDVVILNADFTNGTFSSISSIITGDNGDDVSYVWSKMRSTLKRLDLSAASLNAHFAMVNSDSGDTTRLNLPINVIPSKAFWRGIDIDTDLAPTASEKLKYGMSALEELTLPKSLMGFDKSTIQMLGTMLKGFISDSEMANTLIKYIIDENAGEFQGIGDYAFAYATSLKSISIPYNMISPVNGVGAKAFYADKALTSVTFEKSASFFSKGKTGIKNIGEKAFAYSGLAEINLPQEADSIAQGAFKECKSLATVNFEGSNGVRHIGDYAFMGTAISSITFPTKVTYIGNEALRDCKSLSRVEITGTDSLKMGEKVLYDTPAMAGGTLICSRTVPPTAAALKKKTLLNAYDGTFAGLGSGKTATAVQHGTLITNASKPVSETDGTLSITVPEEARRAYCKADGWTDLLIAPEPVRGDLNDDGEANTSDVALLVNKLLGAADISDTLSDIDGDGHTDVTDVTVLISIILNQ